ncbi:MAG: MFS transporter [Ignavibacteriae bacterium]|nr:MFS transporter [Ignavibacteriota bacterium]
MTKQKIRFSKIYWTANTVELFERAAYYAVFIAITLYLTNIVGFNDVWAAWISGVFSAGLYLLPPFTGALADRIGFRKAIILAFGLLTIGYFSLGAFPYKAIVLPSLLIVMIGGSLIKPVITGTIAKTTSEETRAKGYSIFYSIVNVGAFLGKTFAFPLRINLGLQSINYYSALMTFIALIVVFIIYKNQDAAQAKKTFREVLNGFIRVFTNVKLITLILIVSGFWIIQSQLYATMPKYVTRTIGETASPEWIANVNPFVVMICVVWITNITRKIKAVTSMNIGMFIMPLSALLMASSYILQEITGQSVNFFGLFSAHPITVMMIIGIVFQGLAECFISPRYLEYFSLQAPRGQEGLYIGFGYLYSFFANILGFGISGYLLTAYCPDPKTLSPEMLVHAYDKAYYIWFYFAGIALTAGIALMIYRYFTRSSPDVNSQ